MRYESSEEPRFYTRRAGKHQTLENGNLLISEPQAGRIFEVTPEGETVWSWLVERWASNDSLVPETLDGNRYPFAFADFPRDCTQDTARPADTRKSEV